jgi:lipopolysaccharide export system protein LptA
MTRGMMMLRVWTCAAFACAGMSDLALAQQKDQTQQQSPQSVPNALQGFSQNKDKPVQIEAASLEVRDKEKMATFSGNVVVTQGDTTMKCKTLIVHYDTDSKSSGGMKTAQPGPGGNSSIKKLEALGGVFVTQKDQTATGDKGLFDMKSNSITLSGNVLITQNQNVLKGERLVVDMTTGAARVEGGRVTGVFVPSNADKDSKDKDGKEKDKDKEKDAGKNKDSGKAKDTGKAKTTGKSSNAAKATDTKSADTKTAEKEEAAPATIPARSAKITTQPAPRNTTASSRRPPATRDASAVVESAPATPETSPAPAFAPAPRGSVATPERSNPVAPRGIY